MKTDQKIRVALLAGGKSGEREVSINGAAEAEINLDIDKYLVTRYDPACDLEKLARDADNIDVALIILHGLYGEDGTIQGFLDLLGIPYQGAGVLGSSVAMDKNLSKILYKNAKLPVADWRVVAEVQSVETMLSGLTLPVVIKPVRVGSSLGLTIAKTKEQVIEGVVKALEHDSSAMIEAFIRGREITVGVLGKDDLESLPVIEIIPGDKHEFFDYEAKYQPGATNEVCPAEIDDVLTKEAQKLAIKAHKVLQLEDYSRTDMIITPENKIYLLETNTIPGMTATSLYPQAAAVHGFSYGQLLDRLIELAMIKK